MIETHTEMLNADRVDAGLADVDQGIEQLKPLWELIGDETRAAEVQLFAEQPWEPLAPLTAARKAREFGGKPILRATDVLYKSLTVENAPGNVNRIEDDYAEFGSSNPLAKIHSAGTKTLPARPVLVEIDTERCLTLAGEHLQGALDSAGFN